MKEDKLNEVFSVAELKSGHYGVFHLSENGRKLHSKHLSRRSALSKKRELIQKQANEAAQKIAMDSAEDMKEWTVRKLGDGGFLLVGPKGQTKRGQKANLEKTAKINKGRESREKKNISRLRGLQQEETPVDPAAMAQQQSDQRQELRAARKADIKQRLSKINNRKRKISTSIGA
jgi:hypothetical protein